MKEGRKEGTMASKKRGIIKYKSYSFIDKDPVIDLVRTVVQRSGKSFKEVHENGGATPATLNRWFTGNTRTCRNDSMTATVKAAGGDVGIKMPNSNQWVKLRAK